MTEKSQIRDLLVQYHVIEYTQLCKMRRVRFLVSVLGLNRPEKHRNWQEEKNGNNSVFYVSRMVRATRSAEKRAREIT